MTFYKAVKSIFICIVFFICLTGLASAQSKIEVLSGDALKRIVPSSFYFAGQSGETQFRNSAAAKLGENRFVIAGLVDTSGYSTELQGVYEGFLITDSPINIGGKTLKTGAYGFGFGKDKVNVFDLSSKQILTIKVIEDTELKRPRPLMMVADGKGIRLYKGKIYVLIIAK
jgi:hypothetical protein